MMIFLQPLVLDSSVKVDARINVLDIIDEVRNLYLKNIEIKVPHV